jgi:hypothetical protein
MHQPLVTHLPRWCLTHMHIPTVSGQRRRTFCVDVKRVQLCDLGDIAVVLSKYRRHKEPKHTEIFAPNLPETIIAREVVGGYLRRSWVEPFRLRNILTQVL